MTTVDVDWLRHINSKLSEEGVEHVRRPWEAWRRYSQEFNISVALGSPICNEIFKWFSANSKPGVHQVGGIFETLYFFDSEFWKLSIPITFGKVSLNPMDSLIEMPDNIKAKMEPEKYFSYLIYWAQCLDYGFGFDEIFKSNKFSTNLDTHLNPMDLLQAADMELKSAISQLGENKPNPRAILSCRLALELFIKAYISAKKGLSEQEAKAISHDLSAGLRIVWLISDRDDVVEFENKLSIFPSLSDRYKPQSLDRKTLWQALAIVQTFAVIYIRDITGRNTFDLMIKTG